MSPPVPDLAVACEALIREMRQGRDWKREGRIYVSDLDVVLGPAKGGRCPRQYWFVLRDAPQKDRTPGELLMFENGDRIHELLQQGLGKHLEAQGWEVVDVEQRTSPDPDGEVGGRYDMKIRHRETGTTLIYDLKSKRGAAFRFLNEAKESNMVQVEAYLEGERLKGNEVHGGGILYVDREGQNFVVAFPAPGEEPIAANPTRVKKALYVAKYVRDMEEPPPPMDPQIEVRENKGPDSVYLKYKWQASYCPLKNCACRKVLPKLKGFDWSKPQLVGHMKPAGFTPKEGVTPEVVAVVERLLAGLLLPAYRSRSCQIGGV